MIIIFLVICISPFVLPKMSLMVIIIYSIVQSCTSCSPMSRVSKNNNYYIKKVSVYGTKWAPCLLQRIIENIRVYNIQRSRIDKSELSANCRNNIKPQLKIYVNF